MAFNKAADREGAPNCSKRECPSKAMRSYRRGGGGRSGPCAKIR